MPHSCSPHRLVGGPIPTRCVVVPRQCQSPIVSVPDSVSPVGFSTQHRRTSWCEAALGQAACGCLGTAFDSTHCWPTPDTAHPEACFDEARWVQWVGAMRCEGKRTRATPMVASAPRSRKDPLLSFLIRSIINMFSQSTFVATTVALFAGTSVYGTSQKRQKSNPRLPVSRA
jgi:hypothetical protein